MIKVTVTYYICKVIYPALNLRIQGRTRGVAGREDAVMECGHNGVTVAMATEGGFPHPTPTPTPSPSPSPVACQLPSRSPEHIQPRLLDRNITPWPVCVTTAAAAHSLGRADETQPASVRVTAAGTAGAAERRTVCVGGAL